MDACSLTMDIAQIEKTIKGYAYHKATLDELKMQLSSIVPKTTSNIDAAPASSNGFRSKVEDLSIKRIELKLKIRKREYAIDCITKMIERSGLTDVEKGALWCMANNERLLQYARRNRIKQSQIYKIRDRALKKVARRYEDTTKRDKIG